VRTQEVPVPEPGLTPEAVIGRARALIPAIRAQQDEAERLGHHTPELDRQFTEAGFYRILQPRRFGGYQFGLPTFWRVMLAVSEGDPGTGWALTLGAHHALGIGAWFSEDGQREIFGPSGEFKAPHRAPPMGQAQPAEGGYVVSGTWDYCSGIAHATHFMGNAMVTGTNEGGRGGGRGITAVMPREQVTVLDDWGGGDPNSTLGMSSSGSNSVRVEEVFVPAHHTAPADWTHGETMAPGAALHGPLYCGRIYGVYHAGLVIPVIGAARAALAEYEQIIKTKLTYFPPQIPRYTHPDYQRTYGHAVALTDAAEAIVLHAGDRYMGLAQRWAGTGEPFAREDDVRLFTVIQQAGQLAAEAVQEVFAASSSSAAKRGTRLQRYYRDVAMYRGHIAAQYLTTAGELARVHFGLPDSLF
jgi:3-hydroxy-9,10-secoandrosta-1,3,5(10)-triene-9,17-dione monooxygenase